MGRLYGALAWSQELTPLVSGQVAVVGNLLDPSGLVSPGLSWSISENSSLYVGGYAGLGQRPDRVQLELDPETLGVVVPETAAVASSVRSEYGLLPISVVGQIRTYF